MRQPIPGKKLWGRRGSSPGVDWRRLGVWRRLGGAKWRKGGELRAAAKSGSVPVSSALRDPKQAAWEASHGHNGASSGGREERGATEVWDPQRGDSVAGAKQSMAVMGVARASWSGERECGGVGNGLIGERGSRASGWDQVGGGPGVLLRPINGSGAIGAEEGGVAR
nr:uncharacterized protein LOC117853600 [Setaria viridis]